MGTVKTVRGQQAASLDARGAILGSTGLVTFAFTVWKLLPVVNAALAPFVALTGWLALSLWRDGKNLY
jgi:hypothetical protein